MIQRFILRLSFLIILSTSLKATDLYFFDGLDKFVQSKLFSKGYPSALYYSPSLRFSEKERIKNGRFFGNYGQWNPEFPVHFQAISFDDGIVFCPQDSISSILQLLFPSPGSIELQPNQTISDPINSASFKTLGMMSRKIDEGSMISEVEKSEQTLRDSLHQLFPLEEREEKTSFFDVPAVSLKECITHYKAFLAYDFKKNLALYTAKLLNGISEEDLEDVDFTQDDPDKYTKALKSIEKNDLFEKGLLKDNELEDYILYWDQYNKYKAFKGRKLIEAQLAEINGFKHRCKDELFLEENKAQFKKFIFVETLIQALSQQRNDERSYSYPAFIVQRALVTYFWMKAKNESDIADWFSGLLDVSSDEVMPHIKSRFSLAKYEPWKAMVLERSPGSEEILLNSEKLALLSWGYQLFDAFLPPLIPYGTSRYKGQSFANCVETSCFNFLHFISRRKGEQGYHQDINAFPLTSLAYKIFKQHPDPTTHFSPEVHDEWATMLSARKGVVYCKPGTAPREKRTYELKAGIMNILNCLNLVLADSPEEIPLIHFEEGEEAIENAIAELNQKFSFEAELEESLRKEELKDYFGDLIFKVNDKKSFIWHITTMHSNIEVCEDEENNWRKTVPTEQFLSTSLLREISPQFLSLDFLREQSSRLSPSELSSFCYGVDVRSLKTKLSFIELIFRNRLGFLENFARSLMASVLNLQDYHAINQLTSMLISLTIGDNPVLTDEKMCAIISCNPQIMEGYLENQELSATIEQAIVWAYKNSKKNWVELTAPAITSLAINDWNADLTEFLNMLPQFKKLEGLCLTVHNEFLSLLDYFPSKLESLVLSSSLKEEELKEFIDAFFKKVPEGNLRLFPSIIHSDQKQALSDLEERLKNFGKELGISQEQLSVNYKPSI